MNSHLPPSDGDEGSPGNVNTMLENMGTEEATDLETYMGGTPGGTGANPNGGIPGN